MPTAHDLDIVARTIAGEARGETHHGRIAVGWVIRNRHESGKWFGAGSLADVCLRLLQFSAWNRGDPNRKFIQKLTMDHPVMQQCMHAAISALLGFEADPTCGSTHYYVSDSPRPSWADPEKEVCRIGKHSFFRGID